MKKILAIFLCLATPSWGAVTFDAVGTAVDTSAVTTKDLTTLTVGAGSNRALVAQMCFSGLVSGLTVTWDPGVTNQSVTVIASSGTTNAKQSCWMGGLIAPTSGNKTLRATWTTSREIIMQAVSWTGVDQTGGTTSFPNASAPQGTSITASVTVTSAVGNATMSTIGTGTTQPINSVSPTQTFLVDGIGIIAAGGSRAAGSASNVMTATIASSDLWVALGTDILASAAAASSTVCPSMGLLGVGCSF